MGHLHISVNEGNGITSRAEGKGAEGIRWKSHDAWQEHVMVIFHFRIKRKNLYLPKLQESASSFRDGVVDI
ncbi:hypothetical protein Q8A67_019813 [Cirrhinus molitorella]|uniref:Uncharacterized protein n=1 Tax=Cirrhinus molitorella TaxID=172907 RepID=A0AA88PG90_9TELE|nr:hypothetical protein Q8A67_019813 [Cirrhinus molitorella]